MDRQAREHRKKSIRAKITGSSKCPRLSVFRSSKHIYAAIIDDQVGRTLFSANEKDIKKDSNLTKQEKAFLVGKNIAQKAKKKRLSKVVFDRSGYLYHGRVKQLAEGARGAGLKF